MAKSKQSEFISKLDHYRNITTWLNFWENHYKELSFGENLKKLGENLYKKYYDIETKEMSNFIVKLSDKEIEEWENILKKVEIEHKLENLGPKMKELPRKNK
jgi:tRNA A22 N-methylase